MGTEKRRISATRKNINSLISNLSITPFAQRFKQKRTNHYSKSIQRQYQFVAKCGAVIQPTQKSIAEWELAYVLRSSISGQVSFMQIWTETQTINSSENTFVIIPQT